MKTGLFKSIVSISARITIFETRLSLEKIKILRTSSVLTSPNIYIDSKGDQVLIK
jgi:hypothetical protein